MVSSMARGRSIRVSEAETLFGEEHVQRYRETGGEVGHRWRRGSKILLLTTKGRKTCEPRTTPLIYEEDGDRYVIVASKGGAPAHPGWYLNLQKDTNVELQVLDEVFPARARTAEGEERERLWQLVTQQWPDYDSYQKKTDREIPVVVLERASGLGPIPVGSPMSARRAFLKAISPAASWSSARWFSSFLHQRIRMPRFRFSQEWVASTTQRRARQPGVCALSLISSPRARMCGV